MPNDTNQVQRVLNDPNFYALDPTERTKVLARLDSNFSALPADAQLKVVSRGVQQAPPPPMPATSPQRSIFQRAYDALTWTPPHWPKQGYSEVPEGSGFTGVSTAAGEVSQDLQNAANRQQVQNLTQTAQSGQQPGLGARTKRALLQTGADSTRMLSGATSPSSQAIAAGTLVAPEVAGPLLVGHGLYTGVSNAPAALQGNPDAAEKSLGGFAEAAGGGAVGKGVVDDPSVSGFSRARRVLTPSDTSTYQRIISPNSTGAAAQLSDLETWNRARPYLSQESRANPVLAAQPDGPFTGQRLGVMNLRQNAQGAAEKLWNGQIAPRTQVFAAAPIDHISVVNDIRGSLNPNAPADVMKSTAVNNLADFYNEPTTVGDALQKIQALNEDRVVQGYEKALPDQQAAMLGANPELEAKLTAANSLRDQVFDSIERNGSPDEANYIREARKDYGALKDVAQNLGNAQVPTPQPLMQRVANSVRGVVAPSGLHGYLAQPLDTMMRMSDPNALAETLSRSLADANLQPRQGPPIRSSPWSPAPFNPPPAGPFAPPPVPPQFRSETTMAPNPNAIGPTGRGGIQINALPTEHPGVGNYAGLLPGPPPLFEPPPPLPPVPPVGMPPTLGFPPTMPNPMWDGSGPFQAGFDQPAPNQPFTTPSGAPNPRLQLAPPLFLPKR